MSRWLVALRLARRDALRNRARSLLILVMVALPVTCAVAADTLLRTPDESTANFIDAQRRGLGNADARIIAFWVGGNENHAVTQDPIGRMISSGPEETPLPTAHDIAAALPSGSRLVEVSKGLADIRIGPEPFTVRAMTLDTADPLAAHVVQPTSGRLPTRPGEAAISPTLAASGAGIGTRISTADGTTLGVVGIFPSTSAYGDSPHLVAQPGAVRLDERSVHGAGFARHEWYVDAPETVTWEDVRALNRLGLLGISKAVLDNPPPSAERDQGVDERWLPTVVGLVSAMTILEIVLLAGPAFAVGARRQRRALAQLAVAGGEPRDARRVVLAAGLVIGGLAALIGVAAGLAAAAVMPVLLKPFGWLQEPHQASFRTIAIVAAAAVLSALLAALLPAWSAARRDPVAELTNRRARPIRGRALPLIGAVILLAIGAYAVFYTATDAGGDEISVALAAVPTVLGAVLLAPAAVTLLGRLSGSLPLPVRFAARDASRNRARTAPAVGAVIAVVAGAVALGTGAASDGAERRAAFGGSEPSRDAVIASHERGRPDDIERIARAVHEAAPGARPISVLGVDAPPSGHVQFALCRIGEAVNQGCNGVHNSYSDSFGSALLVGESGLDATRAWTTKEQRERARGVLADGGIAVFATRPFQDNELVLRRFQYREGANEQVTANVRVRATALAIKGTTAPALAVIPESVAIKLGDKVAATSIVVPGPVSGLLEKRLADAVSIRVPAANVFVDRGNVTDRVTLIALAILGVLASVLVLGGTLTATKLALSDAQPEFAALDSVGAAPRTRRLISAAFAGLIAFAGAVLGTAAGLVPGIAVAYPLTRNGVLGFGPYIALPWPLLALLIVGVPATAALVAAATTRSRLPGYARGVGA